MQCPGQQMGKSRRLGSLPAWHQHARRLGGDVLGSNKPSSAVLLSLWLASADGHYLESHGSHAALPSAGQQ